MTEELLAIIKNFVVYLSAYFICFKLLVYDKPVILKVIYPIIFSLPLAVFSHLFKFIPDPYLIFVIITITVGMLELLTKNYIITVVNITILSFGMSYIAYIFSTLIAAVIYALVFGLELNIYYSTTISFMVQITLIFTIVKLKFLSKGKEVFHKRNSGIIGIVLSVVVLMIYSLLQDWVNNSIANMAFIISAICVFGIIAWLYDMKNNYNKRIIYDKNERIFQETNNKLMEELELIKSKLNAAQTEHDNIAKINHKYSQRINAAEDFAKSLDRKFKENTVTEFSNDVITEMIEKIKKLSDEYDNEINNNLPLAGLLPKTGLTSLDIMFEYQYKEADRHGINFFLSVSGSISTMTEKHIEEGKLEILVGDLIKNAIIAINSGNSDKKYIMVFIGEEDGLYKLKVSDTGIPFEIDTLLKLGRVQVTTHSDTGGSGIGFVTTFETMAETGASLIINEFEPKPNHPAKAITVCFDNKCSYIIRSYRGDEIRGLASSDSGSMIVENI